MFSPREIPVDRLDHEDSSADTGKENASVVDSSMTESKHDLENFNDPGSNYKENEECYPCRTKEQIHSPSGLENSTTMKDGRPYTTRYFIIKSLNHHNIELSIEKGIWATQVMNEPILEEAYHSSDRVILIFSVNMSGFFQGYAQMMSSVGWRRDCVWSNASGGSNPWGRTFKVKWLRLNNLAFQKTLHLKNPLNDYKPVKISRDCQELSQDIGEALCELIDEKIDIDGNLKRNNFARDEFFLKRPCLESPVPLQDDFFHIAPLHMAWTRAPLSYPSVLYQHIPEGEASNFHLTHGRSPRGFLPNNPPTNFEASKRSLKKSSSDHGNHSNIPGNLDMSFQLNSGVLSSKRSHLVDSLSEDDFLEMTYEEYLQTLGRSNKSSHGLVVGSSRTMLEPSSKEAEDDRYSHSLSDSRHSQKKTHQPSYK
ncbi:uncharacterized protein LOC122665141 isoform X2 [Telopea speciosissima]|uniref:uncharacterized protein LOC122665141 isoform X2 n=2 Tax=Telopea speciosissima TaxID=54955 RepID=UPI001CC3E1F4|nr:uncharacterized protein LOC122665141 isoform X2 [Telopea speciosissima]